jgi:hypothetical protein
VRSRSCVVHFDRIDLATAFFRSACHWRFGLKNYLLAAKRRCPAPGVPAGGCHERWARPGRSYYPPSAWSKMPRSILLVFDLDGVVLAHTSVSVRLPGSSVDLTVPFIFNHLEAVKCFTHLQNNAARRHGACTSQLSRRRCTRGRR